MQVHCDRRPWKQSSVNGKVWLGNGHIQVREAFNLSQNSKMLNTIPDEPRVKKDAALLLSMRKT